MPKRLRWRLPSRAGREMRSLGVIPNREESIRKLVKKLGPVEQLRFCYEAGPTGYVVYWQLTALGTKCEVVAPRLVPVKSGERVKTDRGDALKLARNYRANIRVINRRNSRLDRDLHYLPGEKRKKKKENIRCS
jgi:transposase